MGSIGAQEILLILVIALVVVGPKRLPELAKSIGKGLREIRRAQDEVRKTVEVSLDADPPASPSRRPAAPSEAAGAAPGEDAHAAKPAAAAGGAAAVADVSRTLGRGLAELRRAREEVQRSFRVDLDDRPDDRPPTGGRSSPGGEVGRPVPVEPEDRAASPEQEERPAT